MLRFAKVFTVLAAAAALTGPARADDRAKAAPVVDIVLCLDVSNSMDQLIASAKGKLWDIVNDLGKVKPAPQLRVGLYSYGHLNYDPKKGWVRKEVDLTADLDTVYQKLNALTIYGGTEYVARVCRDAIAEQKWSDEKKLQELSTQLNRTDVAYGKDDVRKFKAENQAAQDRNAAKAPGAGAARAATKGGGLYRNSDWDLVDRLIDDPKFDVTKVPEAELCDELKKLKPEERVKYVQKKQAEREAIQKEIVELSKKRDEFIRESNRKNLKEGDKLFDEAVRGTLRDQA